MMRQLGPAWQAKTQNKIGLCHVVSMSVAHHDFIDVSDFPDSWHDLTLIVEVEAKAKEFAVLVRLTAAPLLQSSHRWSAAGGELLDSILASEPDDCLVQNFLWSLSVVPLLHRCGGVTKEQPL